MVRSWDSEEGKNLADFEFDDDRVKNIFLNSLGFAISASKNDCGDNKKFFDLFLGGVIET